VKPKGIEGTAKDTRARRKGASGGYMLLNCRMGKLGRSVLNCKWRIHFSKLIFTYS